MATEGERNRGLGAYSTPGVDKKPDLTPAAIVTQNPIVSFKLAQVDPPSPLYIAQGDRIQISVINSDPAVTQLNIAVRLLRAADGQTAYNLWIMPITSNRVATLAQFDVVEGYLLAIQCFGNAGTTRGRCYVQASIVRGAGANVLGFNQPVSDYFSRNHNPTWPNGEYIASVESAGFARGVVGATPAAGADILETVPTGARWRLKSIRFRLVTSATVANRAVKFIIADTTNAPVSIISFNFNQAASITNDYSLGIGVNPLVDPNTLVVMGPIPDNLMFAAFTWKTLTNNLQAGDQFSFVEYLVEEWIEA